MAALRETLELNGQLLTIYQPAGQPNSPSSAAPSGQETHLPQLASEQVDYQEEPLVMDTFHLGGFYSWRLIAGTYAFTVNGDCRSPRLVTPGPAMNLVTLPGATDHMRCAADYAGDLYIGGGRFIYKIAGGTAGAVQDLDLGVSKFAMSMQPFLGNLYVGTATGTASTGAPGLLRKKSAGAWDAGAGTVMLKHLAQLFWQFDYRIIGSDSISSVVHSVADPFVPGNLSGSIPIGDGSGTTYGINRLAATNQHVYISKTNGLYDLDGATGYSPNLMPFFAQTVDDENGIASHASGGQVYTGHVKGLFRVQTSGTDSGRITTVTPGYGLPNETPIRGKITASCADGGWTVVAIYNGTDTYICYGRDIREGDAGVSPFGYGVGYGPSPSALGPSPMLWHGGLIVLPGQKCYLLAISGLTSPPRLWVGAGAPGGPYNVQWCVLPRTDNPMQDAEYQFATAYSLYIPGQDWGHVSTPKNLLEIDVEGENLGIGASLGINVNADNGPYSLFGTANVSPQAIVVGLNDFVGRRIGFRLDGTGTGSSAPIVRSFMPRADIRVATRRMRVYKVLFQEGNVDRMGGRDVASQINAYEKIRALQGQGRVTFRDEHDMTWSVLVEPPVERDIISLRPEGGKGSQEPALLATLRLKLIAGPNSSSSRMVWGTSKYGGGDVWS